MEQMRKKMLYQIFEEAAMQRVNVDGWIYREGFNTVLYDLEKNFVLKKFEQKENPITLQIHNERQFEEKMDTYVNQMILFLQDHPLINAYDNVSFDGHKAAQEKYIMTSVWSNATISDFENPTDFLERRIQFLTDTTVREEKRKVDISECLKMNHIHLIYGIEAQHPNMETPYAFTVQIKNEEGESYALPKISFGICNHQCYIYTIQDLENHQRKDFFYKKINRILYRANKNIEDDYFDEKITDVSPAQVCSLALFLGYMNQKNIDQFEAISYLPMRYQAKELILLEKKRKMENLLLQKEEHQRKEMLKEMEDFFEYTDALQKNITNKFIRNFKRIQSHFNGLTITSYPGEFDFSLHFKTEKELKTSNPSLISDFYQKTKDASSFLELKQKK